MDPFHDFDRNFARAQRTVSRGFGVAAILAFLWLAFLIAVIGAIVFGAGRFLGVW